MFLDVLTNWVSLQRSQWFGVEKLSQIQNNRLHAIISHAFKNIPFYRQLYHSAEIGDTLLIDKLPYLTREQVQNIPLEQRMIQGLASGKYHISSTSGSSGMPLKIARNSKEIAIAEASRARSILAQGARFGDRICQIRPVRADIEGHIHKVVERKRFYGFVRRSRARPIALSSHIDAHVNFLQEWKPHILVASPSYLISLMEFCANNDKRITFRLVRSEGEVLDDFVRKRIADYFQADVFDSYGAAEVGGIAWECPTHEGYHINAELVFVEVIRDGLPISTGEQGDICVTSLVRYTTPFIRYLLGDVITLLDDRCSCGRGLPLMGKIQGRRVDVVVRGDGLPVFPLTILHSLHDVPKLERFQVLQRSDYVVEVNIKPIEGFERMVEDEVERLCQFLFPNTTYVVKVVDGFRENQSKFRPVVSHVVKR